MARIAGVNIPNHQHAEIALMAIYGIGRTRSQVICAAAGVNGSTKMKDLTDAERIKLILQALKSCANRLPKSPWKVICAVKQL